MRPEAHDVPLLEREVADADEATETYSVHKAGEVQARKGTRPDSPQWRHVFALDLDLPGGPGTGPVHLDGLGASSGLGVWLGA